jgi:uncharacterized membrane protein
VKSGLHVASVAVCAAISSGLRRRLFMPQGSSYRARVDLFWGKIAWCVVIAAALAAIWYFKRSRKPP